MNLRFFFPDLGRPRTLAWLGVVVLSLYPALLSAQGSAESDSQKAQPDTSGDVIAPESDEIEFDSEKRPGETETQPPESDLKESDLEESAPKDTQPRRNTELDSQAQEKVPEPNSGDPTPRNPTQQTQTAPQTNPSGNDAEQVDEPTTQATSPSAVQANVPPAATDLGVTEQDPSPQDTREIAPRRIGSDFTLTTRTAYNGLRFADEEEMTAGRDARSWNFTVGGIVRTVFSSIEDDPQYPFSGQNDGFLVLNARPVFIGQLRSGLGFRLQLEGAAGLANQRTTTSNFEDIVARLRDAFIFYSLNPYIEFQVGQFNPPFEVEDQIPTAQLIFVDRSVGNTGVSRIAGRPVNGLSQSRQAGFQITGAPFFPFSRGTTPQGPGVSYGVALTNGFNALSAVNDNDQLAYFSRAALHWSDIVRLGGGFFYNDQTLGDPPDQVGRTFSGWTADLTIAAYGLTLLGSIITRTETSELEQNPELTARAYELTAAYEEPFWGIQPAYRFAYYDPTFDYTIDGGFVDPALDQDALTRHTLGLNYNAQHLPLRIMANYTLAIEQDSRELNNNRFDLLVQVDF